jgi:hypothetical protein
LLLSGSDHPRFVKPAGSKPVRVIRTVPLDDIRLYKNKLEQLLGLEDNWFMGSDYWFDAIKLVPAAYYLAQINTGGIIKSYTLNSAEEYKAHQHLHHMAESALRCKPGRQGHLMGSALRGIVMGEPHIPTHAYNRRR